MFVDSHAHVNNDRLLKDEAEVIAQAEAAGVQVIVNVGWDLPSSKRAVEQAEKYPGVYAAVGIHPHDAKTYTEEALAELARLAKHPKVVALGEMGLDYYYDNSPRDQQRFVFKQQLELARKLGLPVIIHNRDAHGDTWEILQRQEVVGGVMHCYSGSVELAKTAGQRILSGVCWPHHFQECGQTCGGGEPGPDGADFGGDRLPLPDTRAPSRKTQ